MGDCGTGLECNAGTCVSAPTPMPTSAPTRPPIVFTTADLGGITCGEFDADVFESGMESTIGAAVSELGGLHFMVNTAGGGVAQRTIKKDGSRHSLDDFRRIIDLNLIASFNINSIAAQHM